jgi:benzoyl-CoA reductase subunit C
MTAIEELTEMSGTLYNPAMKQWKEQGKKIVGFLCSYVPEEILYAADILPYRVRPTGCEQTVLADGIMKHVNCSYVRSLLQTALEGKYEFLDGLVGCDGCDHSRRLYDVLRETAPFPFHHFISVPHKTGEAAVAWYQDEIALFKESVEKGFGQQISQERLAEALQVFDETRSLLKRLYELRQRQNPPLTGAEALKIVMSATAMPRPAYNALLREALETLEHREGISNYSARVMIMGSDIDSPDYFSAIEDLGGLIVTDGLCFGTRYFWGTAKDSERSLGGLAEMYLRRPACPRMTDAIVARGDFVAEQVKAFKVDGVICETMKYCDLWSTQWFYLDKKLKELKIPTVAIEREYALGDIGQLQTRVQAFLERMEV